MNKKEFIEKYSYGNYFTMGEQSETYTVDSQMIYNAKGHVVCMDWEIRKGVLITWHDVFNRRVKLETKLTDIITYKD